MIMKYHRNKNKEANEDIAELVFLCSDDKLQITYHTEDKRIASSTREFLKPHNWDEKGATLSFSAEMHQTFQVEYLFLSLFFVSKVTFSRRDDTKWVNVLPPQENGSYRKYALLSGLSICLSHLHQS